MNINDCIGLMEKIKRIERITEFEELQSRVERIERILNDLSKALHPKHCDTQFVPVMPKEKKEAKDDNKEKNVNKGQFKQALPLDQFAVIYNKHGKNIALTRDELGISDSTARRYAKNYEELLKKEIQEDDFK